MNEELIITETNSGKDSKGEFLGLEGKLYLPACISMLISMSVYFLAFYFNLLPNAGMTLKLIISAIPLLSTIMYLLCFVHKKPPNYKSDVWRSWIGGSDFNHYPGYIRKMKHLLENNEDS